MRAKKQFGQHLLRYSADAKKIARLIATRAPETNQILEIGPGAGALTAALLSETNLPITAIEFDRDMVSRLQERFADQPRLQIKQGDILTFDLAEMGSDIAAVGNLPYNISAPILDWTCVNRERLSGAVYMLQREVAARVVSGPGGKDWGPLALFTGLYFAARREFTLSPQRFKPPPKVYSSVISLTPRTAPNIARPELFEQTVRAAFASRRKLLLNNLAAEFPLPKERLLEILLRAGIDQQARAEQTDTASFQRLTDQLADELGD